MSEDSLYRSSASFFYYQRGVWVVIMAQLTLAVFSGDTTFALVKRVLATFFGGMLGMLAWYIGSAGSRGNPYGLGAVGFVTFPAVMLFRLYSPAGPLVSIMGPVTFCLVIGYVSGCIYQLMTVIRQWQLYTADRGFVGMGRGVATFSHRRNWNHSCLDLFVPYVHYEPH